MTMRNLVLSALVFAAVGGVSAPAMAIDVVCGSDEGSCSVSNDPVDFVSCACGDSGGTGGTGADEWSDLGEDELFDICLAELELCGPDPGTTTVGTSFGTDTEGTDTGDTGTDDSTTDVSSSDTGTGEGGTAETASGTTDPGTSSDGSEDGSSSGGGSESATAGDATESASASAGDDTSSGSASAGGDGEDTGGCGCSAGSGDRSGLLGFAMVVLAGLRVRRRR